MHTKKLRQLSAILICLLLVSNIHSNPSLSNLLVYNPADLAFGRISFEYQRAISKHISFVTDFSYGGLYLKYQNEYNLKLGGSYYFNECFRKFKVALKPGISAISLLASDSTVRGYSDYTFGGRDNDSILWLYLFEPSVQFGYNINFMPNLLLDIGLGGGPSFLINRTQYQYENNERRFHYFVVVGIGILI